MKFVITGGGGFIGNALCRSLLQQGHELVLPTRSPPQHPPPSHVRCCAWDSDVWRSALGEADGVVNLAGESITGKRWSPAQKRAITDSRVAITKRLVDAMALLSRPPAVLVNASAVGYYGPRGDETLTEADPPGTGFLAELCQAWEGEARRAERLGVRVVRLRTGIVLAPDGGALAKMVPPFEFFLGGPLGSGRQWLSWIHRDDMIGLIEWVLSRADCSGAVNATAPEPATMREFCRQLGQALHRPSWAPVPAPALRLLLGEMAEMLLTGQRVMPQAALRSGYAFRFPTLPAALAACVPIGELAESCNPVRHQV
jgi:uncharacterized protein (TIGR01777 family)